MNTSVSAPATTRQTSTLYGILSRTNAPVELWAAYWRRNPDEIAELLAGLEATHAALTPNTNPRPATGTQARYTAIIATAERNGFPPAFAKKVWASLHGLTPEGRDRILSNWEACALTWTPVTTEQAAELAAAELSI